MTFNDVEFKACPRCGIEPMVGDMCGDPRRPHLMSVTCPACGIASHIFWANVGQASPARAAAMLADNWNRR